MNEEAARPGRRDHGLVRRGARRDGGERRAARDPRRPRRRARRAAVGLQRVPADAGVADPGGRVAGRSVRGAARVLDRRRRVRARVGRVRGRADDRGADRRPRAAGRVRRAAHAERAGRDHRRVPTGRTRRRDRLLDRVGRHRDRHRAARGRLARRRVLLALDLRRERAVRARDARAGPVGRPALHRAQERAARLARRRADRTRPRRPRARADQPVHVVGGAGRRRAARLVRGARAPRGGADAAARPVRAPELPVRQPADLRHVRRARRAVLLPDAVPAAGRGLRRARRPGWRRSRRRW